MTRFVPQWLQNGQYTAGVDRRLLGALWPAPAAVGMVVSYVSAMTVQVGAGQVAVPTANTTGSVLCTSDATDQVVLPTAPGAGSDRIDRVVVRPAGTDIGAGTGTEFNYEVLSGAPAANPVAPVVPAGSVSLAQIRVVGGSASINPANITDERPAHNLGQQGFLVLETTAAQAIAAAAVLVKLTTCWPASPQTNRGEMTWNAATGEVTVKRAGLYRVAFGLTWVHGNVITDMNRWFYGWIYRDDAPVARNSVYIAQLGAGGQGSAFVQKTVSCSAGSRIDFRAQHTHPTLAHNILQGGAATFAEIEQLPY